ncbi:hypothetical protein BpHYR1_006398, partial [Brachionus plicatilis]
LQQASKLDLRRRETIFRPIQSSKLVSLIKLYTDPNQAFPLLCLEHSRFQHYLDQRGDFSSLGHHSLYIDSTEPHDFIHGRFLLTSVRIQSVLELVDGYGLNDLLGKGVPWHSHSISEKVLS